MSGSPSVHATARRPMAGGRRLPIVVACALLAGLVAIASFALRLPSRGLEIPSPTTPTLVAAPVPALRSELNLHLEVAHDTLGEAIDGFVPRRFSGRETDPVAALREDTLDWSLSLGKATLGARAGALAFRIPLTDGRVRLEGRLGAERRSRGALGFLQKLAGVNVRETIEFEGSIEGTIRPRLTEDWTIDPGLDARVRLSRAEAELFGGVLRISFRDAIRDRIDAELDEQLDALRRRVATDGRLITAVERVWNAMHAVVPLSDAPPVWLSTRPVALAASVPVATDDAVAVTLGTTVRALIDVGARRPVVDVRPLAAPREPEPDADIVLRIPVTLRLDRLAALAPTSIGLPETFERPEGQVRVESVSIDGSGDELTVAADVVVDVPFGRDLEATLYVSGTPVVDREANRLTLTDARYDVATESALLGIADFLLEPVMLREIERRSVFELLEPEQELLARARAELALIEASLPAWADADLVIDSGQVTSVIAEGGWLVAILEVTGRASLRLVDAGALLTQEP